MRQFGLDSETPEGRIKVIATNEEFREVESFDSILDFLLQKKHRASIMWTFNLRFDIEHILKATNNKKFLWDIYNNGVKRPGIRYKGCTFQYIQGKLFKICKNGNCITFYDIAQFYNHSSLEKASQKYLPKEYQKDTSSVDVKRLGEEKGYYARHKTDTLAYCRQDAIATLALAKIIEDTFTKDGISFRNPISQAKISEIYVTDHYKYPKVPDGLKQAHGWAYKTYHGGLFWTLQRGYFHQPVYSFDINSAYPAVMAHLPHWGNGEFKWVDSPSPPTPLPVPPPLGEGSRVGVPKVYGWYAAEFDCPWIPMEEFKEGYTIDICYREVEKKITVNPKRIIYPTGTRKQVVTKSEYEWMKKHNFPCKFITGLEWTKTKDKYPSPFEWMPRIYKKRIALKEGDSTGMLQYALKILLNGLYGKTAQAKKGAGRLTNFFYASYITAETRLQVAEVALKHLGNVIEIATDSVTLTKDISAELPISKALGEWGLDEYAEGLFIGSGMRQEWFLQSKNHSPSPSLPPPVGEGRGGGGRAFVTFARGLTDKRDFDMLYELQRNRGEEKLWFTRKRPIHLGEMLVHHQALKYEDLGVFMSVRKRLDVNTDKKQVWERSYENFGDFLDSHPMRGSPLRVVPPPVGEGPGEGM